MADDKSIQRTDAQRNRETVLATALDVLAANPGASMQDIADASELGRSTVYRHFKNRDELIGALQGVAVENARREAARVLARGAPFEETMHELSRAMIETGARYRFVLANDDAVSKELGVARRRPESPIRTYFEECQAEGLVRDDLTPEWIMSAFQSLTLVAMEDHRDDRRSVDDATHCLAESLIGMLSPR